MKQRRYPLNPITPRPSYGPFLIVEVRRDPPQFRPDTHVVDGGRTITLVSTGKPEGDLRALWGLRVRLVLA